MRGTPSIDRRTRLIRWNPRTVGALSTYGFVDKRVRLALSLFLGFIVSMFDLQLVIRIIVVNFHFTN